MISQLKASYLSLTLVLLVLGAAYLVLPPFRIPVAVLIGLSYFVWGLVSHWHDQARPWPVILEYLAISLLATILLIFMSLRA